MKLNFPVLLLSALIPLAVGFVWYNPHVFGTVWMQASGVTEDMGKSANMPLIFGLTYLFSFFLACGMYFMVVHQTHVFSILSKEKGLMEKGTEINTYYFDFLKKYGNNFRTFKHGVFHGVLGGLMLALPIVAINALFECKDCVYIAVNTGYWTVSMALMGGVICQFHK